MGTDSEARDRHGRDDAAPLLIAFVACALAGLLVVIWLGQTASPVVLVVAIGFVVALTVLGAVGLARLMGEEPLPPHAGRRVRTAWPRWLVLVPVVLVPLVVSGAVLAAPRPQRTPVATVRGFLTAAVVDDDGEAACRYLTAQARVDFEGHGLSGAASCQSFFGGAILRLGGHTLASDGQLARMHYVVTSAGPDRLVTVSYDGQAMRFLLRPANGLERQAVGAPQTPWRITSSINSLGAGVSPAS